MSIPRHNCHQSTLPSAHHQRPTRPATLSIEDSPDHLPSRQKKQQPQSSVGTARSMKRCHSCSPRLLLMFAIVSIQGGGETIPTVTPTITKARWISAPTRPTATRDAAGRATSKTLDVPSFPESCGALYLCS
ncbi:hypothetical protein M0R45_032936 [Rubus argutus]|uniref:Uncharacterized protein n=1 Tax=Rubus argutus TaxID=59490 RepID=A0AAW1WML0_RUBAR